MDIIALDKLSFASGQPELSAVMKRELEDFCVDEELGFLLSGEGEHLCIRVKKINISTADVVKRLSERTGVGTSKIGYSGMKDRRGECSQWFSIVLTQQAETRVQGIEDESLQILELQRNARKIRIGCHKSNRFKIRLRDCEGARDAFDQRLEQIKASGVPNYFGAQRFGRQMSNVSQALSLFAGELDDSGAADSAPQSKLKHQRFKRGMLFSAARSYVFNQLLSRRLQEGSWNRYIAGDVLNLNGSDRCFTLEEGAEWDLELSQRLESFDIHITGPMAGLNNPKDRYASSGETADIEDAVFEQFELLVTGLRHFGLKASRRTLRFLPIALEWSWLEGGDLSLEFSLYSGSYATSLLRELCKTD